MKYYVEESLSNFKFWSGAKDRAKLLSDEQFDIVEQVLEDIAPEEGWSGTAINDLFWFDFDTIAKWLGYKNEEYLERNITDDEIKEAQDWFDCFDLGTDAAIEIAGLDGQDYIICNEDEPDEPAELDSDAVMDDFQCWWEDLSDVDKVMVYRKHDTL